MYVCVYVCMCVYACVCVYVCVYARMDVWMMYGWMQVGKPVENVDIYAKFASRKSSDPLYMFSS